MAKWFDYESGGVEGFLGYGFFAHQDGWFDLVWKLCDQIEQIVLAPDAEIPAWRESLGKTNHPPFQIYQVKEKFGSLRFGTSSSVRAVSDLIQKAQEESTLICEMCGERGTLRSGCWWRTRCHKYINIRSA